MIYKETVNIARFFIELFAINPRTLQATLENAKVRSDKTGDGCLGQRSGREPGAKFDRNPVELLPAATRDEMKQRTDYWKGLLQ